jgi:hypothetical protein
MLRFRWAWPQFVLSALLKKSCLALCNILLAWIHKGCLPFFKLQTLWPGNLPSTTVFIVLHINHCLCWLRSKAVQLVLEQGEVR